MIADLCLHLLGYGGTEFGELHESSTSGARRIMKICFVVGIFSLIFSCKKNKK